MTRILMLTPNAGHEQVRVRKQAISLCAEGHAVTVLSLSPVPRGQPLEVELDGVLYRSVASTSQGSARQASRRAHGRGRLVGRIVGRLPILPRPARVTDRIRAKIIEARVVRTGAALEPAVVHHRDLPTIRAASRIAARCGAVIVSDYPELPGHQNTRGSRSAARNQRAADRTMRRYYQDSVLRFTVSEGIAAFLAQEYGGDRPEVIYNSPVVAEQRPAKTALRGDCSIDAETPLVAFVGDVAAGRGIELLLQAVCQIEGLHLAIIGASERRARKYGLDAKVREVGIEDRVHVVPPQAPEHLLDYLRAATLGVYLLEDTCLNHRWAAPNKFFEMLLAGLPLVVSDLSVMGQVVRDYGIGFAVPERDSEAAAEAMRSVIDEPSRYRPTPVLLDDLRRVYGWEAQAGPLIKAYRRLDVTQMGR